MLKLIAGAAPAPYRSAPTALLNLVAGEFAPRVACLWPEPHAAFLTAPAARRHLVCLAYALDLDGERLGERLLTGRLREAVRRVAPVPGLERAVGRLGETAWTAEAYRRLVVLLADPKAARRLRHAAVIDRAVIERLLRLPTPMSLALHLAAVLSDDAATAVAEAAGAIACRSGAAVAAAAAARWAQAETDAALFEAVREDLYPEPPPPPFAGTARLKPLATKAALRDAARRYDNCLVSRIPHAVSGWSAFYEWLDAPGGVVEVSRDAIAGWRLEEAKGPKNDGLDAEARTALVCELAAMGVYVGRSSWQLERGLSPDTGASWRLPPLAEVLAEVFGD